MSRTKKFVSEQLRNTVNFPTTGTELAMKAAGIGNVLIFSKVAADQPHNELFHTATERALLTGTASSFALAGLALVVGANRMHSKNKEAFKNTT